MFGHVGVEIYWCRAVTKTKDTLQGNEFDS